MTSDTMTREVAALRHQLDRAAWRWGVDGFIAGIFTALAFVAVIELFFS